MLMYNIKLFTSEVTECLRTNQVSKFLESLGVCTCKLLRKFQPFKESKLYKSLTQEQVDILSFEVFMDEYIYICTKQQLETYMNKVGIPLDGSELPTDNSLQTSEMTDEEFDKWCEEQLELKEDYESTKGKVVPNTQDYFKVNKLN